jgi:cysteine desulfurase
MRCENQQNSQSGMIYFDNNATTPIDERVLEAMLPFLKTMYGNPSSVHRLGRIAKSAVEMAREQVGALIDAPASQIIFTSGGTEANNFALHNSNGLVAISAIEHPCIAEPAERKNAQIIPVNSNGLIEPETLAELIKNRPDFVSIMLANNETGVIQPIADIAEQLNENGIIFHTDAVQAVGKIPVSFSKLGVQMLSLSSHKIYGAKGCGALVFDKSLAIKPLLLGGGQEQNLRSGTENVAAIVGFGKAAELAKSELETRHAKMLELRTLLENELKKLPRVTIFAKNAPRLPNTILFGIDKIEGEWVLLMLDKKGICVSSGSACASEGQEPSPVLLAMGVSPEQAKTAIRVSLSHHNTTAEVLQFIEIIKSFGV